MFLFMVNVQVNLPMWLSVIVQSLQQLVLQIQRLQYLKLTANALENRLKPNKERIRLPTTIFQGRFVSFRKGKPKQEYLITRDPITF